MALEERAGRLRQRTGEGEQRARSPAPPARVKVAIRREDILGNQDEPVIIDLEDTIDLAERARYEQEALRTVVEYVMPGFSCDAVFRPGPTDQAVVAAPILRPPHADGAPRESRLGGYQSWDMGPRGDLQHKPRISWRDQQVAPLLGMQDPNPWRSRHVLPPACRHITFQAAEQPLGNKLHVQT